MSARRCHLIVVLCLSLPAPGLAAQPPAVDPAGVDRLIRDLGSDDFETREAASKALKKLGEAALPALYQALESQDPEKSRRAKELVEAIEPPLAEKARALVEKRKWMVGTAYGNPELLCVTLKAPTGAELRCLNHLGAINSLTIEYPAGADVDLGALTEFRGLKELHLSGPGLTDARLAAL